MDLVVDELFGRRESVEQEIRDSDEDGQGSDGDSEGEQQQFGADEAVEVPENQEPEKKTVAPKRKVVKNPQPKLDIPRLVGPRGIGILESVFKDVKFQGKGYEYDDLSLLLKRLQHWAHRLFPKLPFDDSLKQMEKLGSKKPLQTHLKRLRLDIFVSPEDNPVNEGEEEVDNVLRGNEPEEDVFDELLRQNAQNLAQATTTNGEGLTDEQRARLEQSRAKAEELRRARRLEAEAAAHRELEEEVFGQSQQEEDAEHEELFILQQELEEEWQEKSQGVQKEAPEKRKIRETQEKDDDDDEDEDGTRGRVQKRLRRISSSSEEEDDRPQNDSQQAFSEARISSQIVDEESGIPKTVTEDNEPPQAVTGESGSPQAVSKEIEPPRTMSEENELSPTVTWETQPPQTISEERPPQTTSELNGHPQTISEENKPLQSVSEESDPSQTVTRHIGSPQTVSGESEPLHTTSREESKTPQPVSGVSGSMQTTVSEESKPPYPLSERNSVSVPEVHQQETAVYGDWPQGKREEEREGAVVSVAKCEDSGQRAGGDGQEMLEDGMPLCSEEEMMVLISG